MNWKKWIALCLSVFIAASCIDFSFAGSSDLKKSQEELKKMQIELKKLTKEKRIKSGEQKNVVKRMDGIESNIQNLESEIGTIYSKIQGAEKSVGVSKQELALAEKKIIVKNTALNARLRTMYKMGHIGYFDVLLGSSDFGDMMTRVDMLQKIYHQDTALLKEMQTKRNQIAVKKVSLERYAKELRDLKTNLGVKQTAMDKDLNALEVEKIELSKDLKALEQREDQLLEDSNRLAKLLEKMKTTVKYVGGKMAWPVPSSYKISSPFGSRMHPVYRVKKMHNGIDISASKNAAIVAAQDGTVIMAEYYFGYGNTVMIDHGGGYVTLYGHNTSLTVSAGQRVKKGQQIAKAGSTGTSTGNHCHFEVRQKGKPINPVPWVTK